MISPYGDRVMINISTMEKDLIKDLVELVRMFSEGDNIDEDDWGIYKRAKLYLNANWNENDEC